MALKRSKELKGLNEADVETTRHAYVLTEDDQPTGEILRTTDSKIVQATTSALSDSKTGKPTVIRPNLRQTQDILRIKILERTGGLDGILDTLESARTTAELPDKTPDHKTRMKAAEVELRLMGMMGSEAAAAVEEGKADAPLFIEGDSTVYNGDRRADFMRRIKAKQLGARPDEVPYELDEEAMRRVSPVAVGETYIPPPLPKRVIDKSKRGSHSLVQSEEDN